MAVEVVAGSVVAHGGSRVGVEGGDLYVARVDTSVEHRGDVGVAGHAPRPGRSGSEPGPGEYAATSFASHCRRSPTNASGPRRRVPGPRRGPSGS